MNSKTFEEKELKILRDSVDYATNIVGKKLTQTEDVKNRYLESFTSHKTMAGGTAVNNILPEQYRFYNRNIEIPDYDFSPYAIDYAEIS